MLSLSHRSLIEVSPPELVRIDAGAGFDAVGFPVISGLPVESWNMLEDKALFAATEAALQRYPVKVLDVEVIFIEADTQAAAFCPLFEAGRKLGAQFVVAVAMDDDEGRVARCLRELSVEAAPYGPRVATSSIQLGCSHPDAARRARRNHRRRHSDRRGTAREQLPPISPESTQPSHT